jgi:hypothetical protein
MYTHARSHTHVQTHTQATKCDDSVITHAEFNPSTLTIITGKHTHHDCCYTVVTLLLHCCYTVVTPSFSPSSQVSTRTMQCTRHPTLCPPPQLPRPRLSSGMPSPAGYGASPALSQHHIAWTTHHNTAPGHYHTEPGQHPTALGQNYTAVGQHHTAMGQHHIALQCM